MQNFVLIEILLERQELINVSGSEINLFNGSFENITSNSQKIYLMKAINSQLYIYDVNGKGFSQTFIYSSKSTINISNLKLIGNPQSLFSVLISDGNKLIEVTNSSFVNFLNKKGGVIHNKDSSIFFHSNIFINNNAINGGAIFTSNSNLSFEGNKFLNNSAYYGGAIYFDSTQTILDLKLQRNNFTLNTAKFGGGAFYSVYNVPMDITNEYLNNIAEYGDNFASPPIVLSLDYNSDLQNKLDNYLPSSIVSYDIVVYLKDVYNNTIKSNSTEKSSLSLANSSIYDLNKLKDSSINRERIQGQILSDYTTRSFIFKNLKIDFRPNSFVILSLSSESIQTFAHGTFEYNFPHFLDSNENYYFLLFVNSSDCPIGYFFSLKY